MIRPSLAVVAVAVVVVLLAGLSLHAAPAPTPTPTPASGTAPAPPAVAPGAVPGDIIVGGVLVLRIRAAAGGLSPDQRAIEVRKRIVNAFERAKGRMPRVTVRQVGSDPAIFAEDVLIVTVDVNHARLNQTTPRQLADLWARRLQEGLAKGFPQPLPGQPVQPGPSPSPTPSP